MLDRETIKTLRLIPEVDLEKGKEAKFTNSDKLAAEVNLGINPETFLAAFYASQQALKASFGVSSDTE